MISCYRKQSNNKDVRSILGNNEDGKWNIFCNAYTGNKTCIPSDPDYFNKYYHDHNKLITCDICGCSILKKIGQQKRTMNCRLAKLILHYNIN